VTSFAENVDLDPAFGGELDGTFRFTLAKEAAAPAWVFIVMMPVPKTEWAEFDSWFTEEHAGLLLLDPHWLSASLVACPNAQFSRILWHEWSSSDPHKGDARAKAGQTDRSRAIASKAWASSAVRLVAPISSVSA
jgi:hypothetical protein